MAPGKADKTTYCMYKNRGCWILLATVPNNVGETSAGLSYDWRPGYASTLAEPPHNARTMSRTSSPASSRASPQHRSRVSHCMMWDAMCGAMLRHWTWNAASTFKYSSMLKSKQSLTLKARPYSLN